MAKKFKVFSWLDSRKKKEIGDVDISKLVPELYQEYCRIRTRIIYDEVRFNTKEKQIMGRFLGSGSYVLAVVFYDFNPDKAEKYVKMMEKYVSGKHFIVSQIYGGKYKPITFYIKPDWKYWQPIIDERIEEKNVS